MSIKRVLEAIPYKQGELKQAINGLKLIEDRFGNQFSADEDTALTKALEVLQEELDKLEVKKGDKSFVG